MHRNIIDLFRKRRIAQNINMPRISRLIPLVFIVNPRACMNRKPCICIHGFDGSNVFFTSGDILVHRHNAVKIHFISNFIHFYRHRVGVSVFRAFCAPFRTHVTGQKLCVIRGRFRRVCLNVDRHGECRIGVNRLHSIDCFNRPGNNLPCLSPKRLVSSLLQRANRLFPLECIGCAFSQTHNRQFVFAHCPEEVFVRRKVSSLIVCDNVIIIHRPVCADPVHVIRNCFYDSPCVDGHRQRIRCHHHI